MGGGMRRLRRERVRVKVRVSEVLGLGLRWSFVRFSVLSFFGEFGGLSSLAAGLLDFRRSLLMSGLFGNFERDTCVSASLSLFCFFVLFL